MTTVTFLHLGKAAGTTVLQTLWNLRPSSQRENNCLRLEEVHMRRRQLFLDLAAAEPARFVVVDGSAAADKVADDIWQAVCARFPLDLGHAGPAAPDPARDRIGG